VAYILVDCARRVYVRRVCTRVSATLPQVHGGMLPYQDTCILHADTYTLEIRIGSPHERRFAFARIVPASQVEW
jgi:hypothetical protein